VRKHRKVYETRSFSSFVVGFPLEQSSDEIKDKVRKFAQEF
jgi:RNase H-fold protein (predicted Holliday junction resolvase)